MAPVGESFYFPSLDKCLDGDHLLLSWESAFAALSSARPERYPALEQFLADDLSVACLSQPFEPFQSPNSQSKSAFETKTAAINVTPAENGRYDINQIKQDALWLSEGVKIEELSALRIVLLEWQNRPVVKLSSGLTEQEILSVQDAAGGTLFGRSNAFTRSITVWKEGESLKEDLGDFNSTQSRRERLLRLFLSERSHVLKVAELLICASISAARAPSPKSKGKSADEGKRKASSSWIDETGRVVLRAQSTNSFLVQNHGSFVLACTNALELRVSGLVTGAGWFSAEGGNPDMETLWGSFTLMDIATIMRLIFVHLDRAVNGPSPSEVLAWYRFARSQRFFQHFQVATDSQQPLLQQVQLFTSLLSLLFLSLPQTLDSLVVTLQKSAGSTKGVKPDVPLIKDSETVREVNSVLIEAAGSGSTIASVAIFAWSIILQALRSILMARHENSDSPSRAEMNGGYSSATENGLRAASRGRSLARAPPAHIKALEETLEVVMDVDLDDDPIVFLATNAATICEVYEVIAGIATSMSNSYPTTYNQIVEVRARVLLLDVIRESLPMTKYGPEVMSATLAILNGAQSYWEDVGQRSTVTIEGPVDIFLRDEDVLLPGLLTEAQLRYPYELLPFLRLCKALSTADIVNDEGQHYIGQLLEKVPKFTHVLPPNFKSYELFREDENANCIQLTQSLDLFFSRKSTMLHAIQHVLTIPQRTIGFVINDAKPFVTTWEYPHSALSYLGNLLSTALAASDVVEFATLSPVEKDIAPEIIGLFSVLVASSIKATGIRKASYDKTAAAQRILEDASDGLSRNQDIVTVIFAIFEKELQSRQWQQGPGASTETVTACMQFCHTLMSVLPGRVWSLVARSELLESEVGGSKLAAIIASTEMLTGRYPFLLSSLSLFEALIEDAISSLIARKMTSKTVTRFSSNNTSSTGVSDKSMSHTLLAFTRLVIGVLEGSRNWRFDIPQERMGMNNRILKSLDKILFYAYGFDDSKEPMNKHTGTFAPAARYIVDVYLSASLNDLPLQPVLDIYFHASRPTDPAEPQSITMCRISQTRAALRFSTTLLMVGRLSGQATTRLEMQLFKTSALLARLYAIDEPYRLAVIVLLDALVNNADRATEEPPSLLGHMGPDTARCFLELISHLSQPLLDAELERNIWILLSSVVSTRQQWFTIYVLTGSTPRESLKRAGKSTQNHATPLLKVALDKLSALQSMEPKLSFAMLRFVALAVNSWQWATDSLGNHSSFMNSILDFVVALRNRIENEQYAQTPFDRQIAACIAEILTIYLRNNRLMGEHSIAKDLVPKIAYFRAYGVTVLDYNSSLHANLKKNLENRFSGCSPASFKRTGLVRPELGRDYYYDLEFASKVLCFDKSWLGGRSCGFAEEFARANLNLSVVESQAQLLLSWKYLVIELTQVMDEEPRIQKLVSRVVRECLKVNAESNLPESVFEMLQDNRADLAFVLLQKLVAVRAKEPTVKALVAVAWETVRSSGQDFELAFTGAKADYYRSLLRILFLTLRFHAHDGDSQASEPIPSTNGETPYPKPPENAPLLLEILSEVIAKGFRSLSNQVHETPANSSPSDFALLTAILQSILRIPGISLLYTQITLLFSNQNTTQYATALFSWSDRLAIDADPIHGDLSILFLVSLSTIPQMAEHLATEGLLSNLSTANLINYYRSPGGMGPFDTPARLHSIWSRGILPICLNLLRAVGPPIATEVAAFLTQFPDQIARAADALDSKHSPANTTSAKHAAGGITAGLASELHSLALVTLVLDKYRALGAAAGLNPADIPEVVWDKMGAKEDIEGWLQGRGALRERIVATSEREVQLARAKPQRRDLDAENRLEEIVVGDLMGALECLNAGNGGSGMI